MNKTFKTLLDFLPLAIFLVVFKWLGMELAIAALMIGTFVTLSIIWIFERHVALMPLITAVLVGVFGGLSLWLHDERFIKMKPTIIYGLFSAILLIGCWRGKALLQWVTGQSLQLTERGWWLLSVRFGWFFLFMAALNEIIWRTMPTDWWVNFKVFGGLLLTFIFAATQARMIERHQKKTDS